jgi:uncharacterized membrane protein YraQ (UPF0718 family)
MSVLTVGFIGAGVLASKIPPEVILRVIGIAAGATASIITAVRKGEKSQ